MEKNSFEEQLRDKILQAEETIGRGIAKEMIWQTVQAKNRKPEKIRYYAATVLLVATMAGILYAAKRNSLQTGPLSREKKNLPEALHIRQLPLHQNEQVKAIVISKKQLSAQSISKKKHQLVDTMQKMQAVTAPITEPAITEQKTEPALVLNIEKIENVIAQNKNNEKQATQSAIVPDFTVQFKRGREADETEKPKPLFRIKFKK